MTIFTLNGIEPEPVDVLLRFSGMFLVNLWIWTRPRGYQRKERLRRSIEAAFVSSSWRLHVKIRRDVDRHVTVLWLSAPPQRYALAGQIGST